MGIKAFVQVIPEDEETASKATMKKYKEVISRHTASNQGMSGVELTGITFLDEKMKLRVNSTSAMELDDAGERAHQAETVELSVRDVLIGIDMPDPSKPSLYMVAETMGGSHDRFYPENADREQMAQQHPCVPQAEI